MELQKTAYLIIISSLIAIILLFAYLNIRQSSVSAEVEPEKLESCKSLVYNGEDRIDLLFLASESDTQRFSDALLNTPPYDENKDYFNVFFIDDYEPTCEDYKDIAILCNTKENLKEARRCPNDYPIVIKDKPSNIRSSAFGNVISINKNHENSVIVHEFGHAFGNLAEEYTPAKLPRGAKNCVSSCDKFEGIADSCSQECSQNDLFRSINAGVMRTLITSDYGQFNIQLLKKLLEKNKPDDASITGQQIAESYDCSNQKIVPLEIMQASDGTTKVESTNIELAGCAPDNAGEGNLCIGDLCYPSMLFTEAQDISTQSSIEGETFDAPDTTTTFYVNKLSNTETIEISLDEVSLSKINLAQAGATACNT